MNMSTRWTKYLGASALALGLMFASSQAQAADGKGTYDVGYSTFVPVGIICTTGTVRQLNATRPTGFTHNIAGYRIQNHDSADSVYIGTVRVSSGTNGTDTHVATLGERLAAGASGVWHVFRDRKDSNNNTPIYCLAADAAGAAGAVVTVTWFGY